MTSSHTYAPVRVHTATHLSEVIMGALSTLVVRLGLRHAQLHRTWEITQAAIKAWILEGSLQTVVLECTSPSNKVGPVIEFPVRYDSSGSGDIGFTASRARLDRFMDKLSCLPAGSTFRLFCEFNGYHSDQPGWSAAARGSTAGMGSTSFGTLASGPGASAGIRVLR